MPSTMHLAFVFVFAFGFSFTTVSHAHPGWGFGFRFGWGHGSYNSLSPNFYDFSCPQANYIVLTVLDKTFAHDPRMAASLLRLHFHDCFVQGCDASVLLDDSATIVSEKHAAPNANSLRGFDVIDEIKEKLEEACPGVVSCADILALAARGATFLSGGPHWELPLGRRDSRSANLKLANNSIPPPIFNIRKLVSMFKQQGLDETDLVALSGGHTIGMARCTTFKTRLYNQQGNPPDLFLEKVYLNELRSTCPPSGGDNNTSPLDYATPMAFDNTYFKLILGGRGLLGSDQALWSGNEPKIASLVEAYSEDRAMFFSQFARSMVKMGDIKPILGSNGEVRKNCRRLN